MKFNFNNLFFIIALIFLLLTGNFISAQTSLSSTVSPRNVEIPESKGKSNLLKVATQNSGDLHINPAIESKPLLNSITCGKIYATGYSSGRNSLYELNGSIMTPVFTSPQIIGGLAISANGNAYYDDGTFAASPLYRSDSFSQTNTGAITNLLLVGEAADAIGNVYYIDANKHLKKNIFNSIGNSTDLGAIVFNAGDTIGPTLAYGDMTFDGNGRLFWYSSISGTGNSYLYIVDTITLKASSLGKIGPDAATGLAFDTAGKLITTSNQGTSVISIDLSSPSLDGIVIGTANPSVYDLGSCATPLFNPILNATKSVANITSGANPATIAQVGDVLEYTIVVNNSGNINSNNSLLADAIPPLTTYMLNSTTMNGIPVADVAGNMPFATPAEINSPTQLLGIITVGSSATITFRVTININSIGTIPNTATINYPITNGGITTTQTTNSNTVIVSINPVVTVNEIDIYNHLTPNGDATNEFFLINGIDKYPDNTVEIYNRWGVLVYEATGYNNIDKSFKGVSDGRVTVNRLKNLPVGTYYYILKYNTKTGETKENTGYLYLNR